MNIFHIYLFFYGSNLVNFEKYITAITIDINNSIPLKTCDKIDG